MENKLVEGLGLNQRSSVTNCEMYVQAKLSIDKHFERLAKMKDDAILHPDIIGAIMQTSKNVDIYFKFYYEVIHIYKSKYSSRLVENSGSI